MTRVLETAAAVLLVVGAVVPRAQAQAPVSSQPTSSSDYSFRSPVGLLVFHVRPEHVESFEFVVSRLTQGLEGATDAVRRQQRLGWRMFRSTDAPVGAAIFVMVADPTVVGTDYDPVRMITELLPGESQPLYDRLKAAVIKVERMGLVVVQ